MIQEAQFRARGLSLNLPRNPNLPNCGRVVGREKAQRTLGGDRRGWGVASRLLTCTSPIFLGLGALGFPAI